MTVVEQTILDGYTYATTASDVVSNIFHQVGRTLLSAENITDAFTIENQVQFTAPELTNQFANTPLRFGHSADITTLLSNDSDMRNDYIWGLAFIAIFMLGIYSLWLFVILVLCCCGSKRVGFLSGQPFQRQYYYINNGEDINKNSNNNNNDGINDSYISNPYEVNTLQDDRFNDDKLQKNTMTSSGGDIYRSDDDDDVYIEGNSYDNGNNGNNNVRNKQQEYYSTPPNTTRTNGSAPYQMTKTNGGIYCCKVLEQQKLIRGIYVISGILFITFAILSVTKGLTNLQGTVDSINDASQRIANTTLRGDTVISNLLNIREQTKELAVSLTSKLDIDSYCPNAAAIVNSNDNIATILTSISETSVTKLQEIEGFIDGAGLDDLQVVLQSSNMAAKSLEETTQSIELTSWRSLIVLIPYTIIPAILVAKCIMAAFGANNIYVNSFIVWFIHPLFIVLVILSAISAAMATALASTNADFCYPNQYVVNKTSVVASTGMFSRNNTSSNVIINSPDVSVLKIIQNAGYDTSSTEYQAISFYVLQCFQQNPFIQVTDYLPKLDGARKALDIVNTELQKQATADAIAAICTEDASSILTDVKNMINILDQGIDALIETFDLIQCSNIVPIYQTTVYAASCEYSMIALIWFFSSSTIMATFGLLMILFRSSILDTQYTYTYDTNYGRSNGNNNNNNNNMPPTSGSNNRNSAFHDENDYDHNDFDGQTRAGYTTAGNDTVMNSLVAYEKNNF